ncbi:ParB/RepB/Spo0J family partition protein [Kitasatospora sp. MBT63]|uniref:ParB/RepB/Spo0J family partition protein n=1 Tax=Kitasatospora sp. MBT63 TaxID=1444768 RepID=UPI000691883A|nr:ParB/RepB/Spo0J family partition protein [Kitasatospora sp. MBT63]
MGTRTSLAALATLKTEPVPGQGATTVPSVAPATAEPSLAAATVPLEDLILNPYNPRKTLSQEAIEETAASLQERGQLQALAVVTREAFLAAHPGKEAALAADTNASPTARYVVLDGNRRLRAARLAVLDSLRVDLNDDLAATASEMLENSLIANIFREDVAPIEEAQAIQELLDTVYDGRQAAVARALGKSGAWVSQRLALLHLEPELLQQVEAGTLKVKEARSIGAAAKKGLLTPEQQVAAAAEAIAAAEVPRTRESTVNPVNGTPVPTPSLVTATSTATVNPVNAPAASPSAATIGAPREPVVNPVNTELATEPAENALTVSIDPSDMEGSAQTIRAAVGDRKAVALVRALIESLKHEPDIDIAD